MKKIIGLLLISGLISMSSMLHAQKTEKQEATKSGEVKGKTEQPAVKPRPGQEPAEPVKVEPPKADRPASDGKAVQGQEKGIDKAKGNEKEFPGKGHAYGRDKGGLKGKEFGQHRAEEARGKQEVMDKTDENIRKSEASHAATREKIKEVRKNLEEKKAKKEITKEEYDKKVMVIDEMEKEVERLEKENKSAREQLEKKRSE